MDKSYWENIGAVVALAGDLPRGGAADALRARLALAPRPLLAAADGGALLMRKLGLTPDIILGDGDSLPAEMFPDTPREKYPTAKDFTDGEAALTYAKDHTEGDIAVCGAFGGRVDHQLANILLPIGFGATAERFILLGDGCICRYCTGRLVLRGKVGDTVSLLALGGDAEGVTLAGMRYLLANNVIKAGSSLGISNVLEAPVAEITVEKGCLLVIHYPRQ